MRISWHLNFYLFTIYEDGRGKGIHALVTDSVAVWNDSVPAVGHHTLGYSIKTISNLDCQLFILNIAIDRASKKQKYLRY